MTKGKIMSDHMATQGATVEDDLILMTRERFTTLQGASATSAIGAIAVLVFQSVAGCCVPDLWISSRGN